MPFGTMLRAAAVAALTLWTAGCASAPIRYAGPGCLMYLYPAPALAGTPIPVRTDTTDLASVWHDKAASAKIVYGTWRFFAEATFRGFMGDYRAPSDIHGFLPDAKPGSLRCIELEPAPLPPSY